MARPRFRLTCCLCTKLIPAAGDAFDLDAEWRRRFPRLRGTLACEKCATGTTWSCERPGGGYVDGHIPSVSQPLKRDFDSWSHIGNPGTQLFRVVHNPWSGLLQGAEDYLRWRAQSPLTKPAVARRLRAVLDEWDSSRPTVRQR